MDSELRREPHFTQVKFLIGAENVELVYIPGAQHADPIFPSSSNMSRVVQFFDRHLR